jgi:Fis family transcriptional regulator, factor for inversion stimulation protein
MKSERTGQEGPEIEDRPSPGDGRAAFGAGIAASIDQLVEYLADNDVTGIHPLIMGEVEKRLMVKALEKSRGNKLQAARLLGMSRNTFHKKIRKLFDSPGYRQTEHKE